MASLEIEILQVPVSKRLRRAGNLRRHAKRLEHKRGYEALARQMRITAHMELRLAAYTLGEL